MAKKSGTRAAKVEAVGAVTEPPPVEVPKAETFAFPNKSRCINCKSLDTEAYKTEGAVQYRRCNEGQPRCGTSDGPGKFKYKVTGRPV